MAAPTLDSGAPTAPPHVDRRFGATAAVTCAAAAAVLTASIWFIVVGRRPGAALQDVLLVTAVVAVAGRITLRLRVGTMRHTQSLADTAIMLGLMMLPAWWLAPAVAIGLAAAKTHARLTPLRIAFYAAKGVLLVAVSATAGALLGLGMPLTTAPDRIPQMLLVATVLSLADDAMSVPVIAMLNDHPVRQVFTSNAVMRIGGSLTRLFMAVIAGALLHREMHLAIALPVVVAAAQFAYLNRIQQRSNRMAWQRLAAIADELSGSDDYALRRAVITGAAELFSCDEVEVELHPSGGPASLMRGDLLGIRYAGPPEGAPATLGRTVSAPLESSAPAAEPLGRLQLRFRSEVQFGERERYTLRAIAAQLGTALHKSTAVAAATRMAHTRAHAATHDDLTGLANRRGLLEATRDRSESLALLVLDLNQFRAINESLGRALGDRVIAAVGERLAALVAGTGALAAHLGGDEFAVLLSAPDGEADALAEVDRIGAALADPFPAGPYRLQMNATIGVAIGDGGTAPDELLRQADVAMHRAKEDGVTVTVYSRESDTADPTHLALSADLVRAVEDREFIIAFQPIVDLATGAVVATEALARWLHPLRGHLTPQRFLAPIERSGLLAPFTAHVLDLALTGARQWRAAGFTIPVAVNVSPRSLLNPAFADLVTGALARHELEPGALMIELTETLTLSQADVVDEVLHALHDTGIGIALDDFGTGFSSLASVARVPVRELKIDRTFVSAIDDPQRRAIIRSMVELGRELDLLVVAEGIETPDQRQRLWALGCSAGQGHLFARPLTAEQFIARLERGHGGVRGALAAPMPPADVIRLPAQRRPRRAIADGADPA